MILCDPGYTHGGEKLYATCLAAGELEVGSKKAIGGIIIMKIQRISSKSVQIAVQSHTMSLQIEFRDLHGGRHRSCANYRTLVA